MFKGTIQLIPLRNLLVQFESVDVEDLKSCPAVKELSMGIVSHDVSRLKS